MFMLVCLPCCLLLSGLLLLGSVSFWSCEDSFDYVRLSFSWTRSSSLRDLRQDDHYPWYHFYLCLLVASFYRCAALPITSSYRDFRQDDRYSGSHYYHCYASCFVLSLCCATYHMFFKPPKLPCQPLTFCTLPSKPLLGYVTALLNPSYSIVSCRWRWRLLHGE